MSMAQKGLTQMAQSEQIMKQVRGALMEAAQQAATQAVLSRVTAISDGLTARAEALGEVGGTTVEGTAGTVKGTAETVSDHDSTAAATTDTGGRPATRQRMRHAPRRAPSERHHHCDCDHFGRIRPAGLDFQLTMAAHMPAHCALRWRRSGITGNIWIDLQMSMADI